MKIFFYIFNSYMKFCAGIIGICVFLITLFDFIHKTTRYFAEYQPSGTQIFLLYFYQLPFQITQAIPIGSLLSSVITMVLLSRTNEITAMRSVGLSPFRIGVPIAAGGILLSALNFGVGEFIAPAFLEKSLYVQNVLIEKNSSTDPEKTLHWLRKNNRIIYLGHQEGDVIRGMKIIENSANFLTQAMIQVPYAKFDATTNTWRAPKAFSSYFNSLGILVFSEEKYDQRYGLPIDSKTSVSPSEQNSERSLGVISSQIIQAQNAGVNATDLRVNFHFRLAFYFASFVVSLIGIQFAFQSERSVETAQGILLAIGIGVSYWFIASFARTMAKHGTLPVPIAAWLANIVVFVYGSWNLSRNRE